MPNELSSRLRTATTWSIVVSVLLIAAGVLAIAAPQIAGIAITAVVAWLLLISAILHLMLAWRSGTAGGVVWEILLGVVYGAIAFYLFAHPALGMASLTLALAVYLVIEGMLEFAAWWQLRASSGSVWLLLDGIVTLVLAMMIASTWPSSAAWVLGTLVGLSMLFSGISRLMLSLSVRRFAV
jgi:uncharacterized membrane protein HdeD (DUF308 family)